METTPQIKDNQVPLATRYCDKFWNNFDSVIKQIEASRSELKEFLNLIESRAKIQFAYADKLLQLSKVQLKPNRSSLSQQLVNAYAASLKKKSQQTRSFSNLLLQTGVDKLMKLYQTSGVDFKRLKDEYKDHQKQLITAQQDYKKIYSKLDKRKKELQEIQLQYMISSTCRQFAEKKQSLSNKAKQKYNQYSQVNKQCKNYYSHYSKTKRNFEKSTKQILQTLYESEIERLDKIIDSFVNIHLVESSSCKNRLVYIEDESQFISTLKPENQIKKIMDRCEENLDLKSLHKPSSKDNYLHVTYDRLNSKKIEEVIKYGDTHRILIKKVLSNIEQVENDSPQFLQIAKYIKKMWQNALNPEDTLAFCQHINSVLSRKDFVICLQQQRMIGKFEVMSDKLEVVIDTINLVLNKCHQQRDSYTAKHILVLMFTYFTNVKQQQKVRKQFLHIYVKNNHIWKSTQFWQSALIESLYEESKGQQEKTTLNLKGININNEKKQNLVLNQLAYYVHNMIMLDWQGKKVKQYASKFIKLYNLDQILAKQDTIQRAQISNNTVKPVQTKQPKAIQPVSVINSLMKMFSREQKEKNKDKQRDIFKQKQKDVEKLSTE